MSLSIRRRVQLYLVTLTGLLLATFAGLTYLTVRESLLRGIDADLRARAAALAALVEREGDQWEVELEGAAQPSPDLVRNLTAWSISTHPDARALLMSPGLPAQDGLTTPELSGSWQRGPGVVRPLELAARFEDFDLDHARAFVGIFAVRDEHAYEVGGADAESLGATGSGSPLVRIVVVADATQIDGTLRLLLMVLGAIGVVTLIVAAAVGGVLSATIVRPLARIAADAETVVVPDPVREVRGSGTGDEIDRLAATLNRVFRRLGEAYERQMRFTADASHELRTPLSAIRTHADVSLRRSRTEAEYREALVAIQAETIRLSELLEALLSLARFDAGTVEAQLQEVQLDELARTAVAELAEEGDTVEMRVVAKGPAWVRADPRLLMIVLRNLLSNAQRHCSRPGSVEVRVTQLGDETILEVHDDGSGISPEALEHVFERFYRADSSRARSTGAAGLGLAIVAAIASYHGGSVAAASLPGTGTTFTVRLPRPG